MCYCQSRNASFCHGVQQMACSRNVIIMDLLWPSLPPSWASSRDRRGQTRTSTRRTAKWRTSDNVRQAPLPPSLPPPPQDTPITGDPTLRDHTPPPPLLPSPSQPPASPGQGHAAQQGQDALDPSRANQPSATSQHCGVSSQHSCTVTGPRGGGPCPSLWSLGCWPPHPSLRRPSELFGA